MHRRSLRHKEAVIRLIGGISMKPSRCCSFHTFPTFPHNFCFTPKKAWFAMPLKAKKSLSIGEALLFKLQTWLVAKLMACIAFWGFGLTIPALKYFFRFWEKVRKVLSGAFLAHCVRPNPHSWRSRGVLCDFFKLLKNALFVSGIYICWKP